MTLSAVPASSKPPTPTPLADDQPVALQGDVAADQRGALQRLHLRRTGVFSPSTVVLSFSMPLTVLICAIWLVTCALSIGFSGSWFCICVTSSFRKRSALPASFGGLRRWRAACADGMLVLAVDSGVDPARAHD